MTQNLAEERMQVAREALTHTQPLPSGTEPGGLPLGKLFGSLFRARWFLVLTMAVGFMIGLFLAVTTPNTYVSQGKFHFATTGSETINLDPTRASETEVGTIAARAIHVLTADRLLRRVIEKVSPEAVMAPYRPEDEFATGISAMLHRFQRDWNARDASTATVEDALLVLRRRLNLSKPRNTDVLVATYVAHDRKLAQQVLEAYMELAPQFHQELYDKPEVYGRIQKSSEDAELAKVTAEQALRRFLVEEVRIPSGFEFELESLRERENESRRAFEKNQRDVDEYRVMVKSLQELLKTTPPTVESERRTDVTAELVQGLYDQIIEQEKQLLYLVRAERRKSVEDQIKLLEGRIRKIQAEPVVGPPIKTIVDNKLYVGQQLQLANTTADLATASAITKMLEKNHRIDAQKLSRLLSLEPRYRKLQSDLTKAEAAQTQAAARFAAAETKRQLQAANFSSINVLEDASMPLEKEGPNRMKLILGGLVVGMFIGLGVTVMRSLPDTTVRQPIDLEKLDGVAVIGVLPKMDGRNVRRHQATRARGG